MDNLPDDMDKDKFLMYTLYAIPKKHGMNKIGKKIKEKK
jgi:hypothetical protein